MAAVAVLAAGWTVNIGTTPVLGLEELEFDMAVKEADKTSFQSCGYEEHYIALRGRTLKMTGYYLEDSSGAQDPGQAAVEALAEQIGALSLGSFTLSSPGGSVRTFLASARVESVGGKKTDNTKWVASLKVSGAVTTS